MLKCAHMAERIVLNRVMPFEELVAAMRNIEFRGLYREDGTRVRPYEKAKFSLATVKPSTGLCVSPTVETGSGSHPLFSPQPTIYQNQTQIIRTVDESMRQHNIRVHKLESAIHYTWEGRGDFHMLPPVIERHAYTLDRGFIDLHHLIHVFKHLYVKDAQERLHRITDRYLREYFIDEVSAVRDLDVFHSNAPLINYGQQWSGVHPFHIVCDGMHRIDYAVEALNEPVNVILVEPEEGSLIPYYAFPMPYHPTIRLSSKLSEKMYPRLERDKVHLFNDFLKKVLHYDWSPAGFNISKLRSNAEIF